MGAGFAAELVQTLTDHLGLHQRENAFWKIPPVSQWFLSMIFFFPPPFIFQIILYRVPAFLSFLLSISAPL